MPGDFRCDRGDYTRVLPTHCTRGCGRIGRPAFPAPSDVQKGGMFPAKLARRRGEIAKLCPRSCLKLEAGLAIHMIRIIGISRVPAYCGGKGAFRTRWIMSRWLGKAGLAGVAMIASTAYAAAQMPDHARMHGQM